jgi:hypothetical protein
MTSSTVRLVAVGRDARPAWQEIAEREDGLSACHLPQWMDCLQEVSGYRDATRQYETRDGRRLLLPLAVRPHRPPGFGLYSSWPDYWNGGRDNGGLISEGGPVTTEDIHGVAVDLSAMRAIRICVTPSTGDAQAWARGAPPEATRIPEQAHVVDLRGGADDVWHRFSSATRRACRRAERRGVDIECDATGRLLPDFLELYRRSLDRWATDYRLPKPIAREVIRRRHTATKLQVVARRLGTRCQVWIARHEGAAASGFMLLSHGPAALYWKGAMDKALEGGSGANDLLHRCAMEAAIRDGRLRYDLGPSGRESLARFKTGLGANLESYQQYVFGEIPGGPVWRGLRTAAHRVLAAARPAR